MSHSYSPAAAYSQMDENKQDLPKKLVEPFGSSCQFESAGNEAFSLSERRKGGVGGRGQRWRWRGLGGSSGGGGGVGSLALCKQRKVQLRGQEVLRGLALLAAIRWCYLQRL